MTTPKLPPGGFQYPLADIPRWAPDAPEALVSLLRPDSVVLEYGSGGSTIWFARRCGRVITVEHHGGWKKKLEETLKERGLLDKVDIRLVAPDKEPVEGYVAYQKRSYHNYVMEGGKVGPLDGLAVDGRARVQCYLYAEQFVVPDGFLVLDDCQRPRYREHFPMLKAKGWRLVHESGARSIRSTAIWVKS